MVVKRFQANNSNFCRSRARASLRDQPLALPAWDQQEETEQSDSRTDRGRAIDTRVQSELVSSIVPRGTSLRWIVVLSLRQFGVRRSDCRRHFPCPAELGSITPHAMHKPPHGGIKSLSYSAKNNVLAASIAATPRLVVKCLRAFWQTSRAGRDGPVTPAP